MGQKLREILDLAFSNLVVVVVVGGVDMKEKGRERERYKIHGQN